jgi:hypothetical protein
MNENPLIPLFGYFALLSLFAVGGASAAIGNASHRRRVMH